MDVDPPDPPETTDRAEFDEARGAPVAFGALLFGFGLAAGFLLAFSGYSILQDSAGLIVTVFLSAIFVIGLLGSLAILLRKPLLRRVFGIADTQLQRFADPLAQVAEGAVDRDPHRATAAARQLVRLALARYAWLSTRRWIIASLTGLIAAMAALAGTALLFKQNELLAVQSRLMQEQNDKLQAQSAYLAQDVQLAEAARNAELAVEITNIADLLGQAMTRAVARDGGPPQPDDGWGARVPVLDPLRDLDPQLVMRITSASRAVKPYRFLDPRLRAHDDADKIRVAMERRRAALPVAFSTLQGVFDWTEPPPEDRLIPRPASPERAQLLQTLIRAGLRDYEALNWFGLDLSFAYAEDTDLLGISMQGGQLSYARFDRAQVMESDFRSAALENASFRKAVLRDSLFSAISANEAKPPYQLAEGIYPTALAGVDFSNAFLLRCDFSGANAGAANFDGATFSGGAFSGAQLGAATFLNAVLLGTDFDGADLRSVDFDGAFVFAADALSQLADQAAPGSFRVDRYEQVPATLEDVFQVHSAFLFLTEEAILAQTGARDVWRLRRVKPFEAD
ncbi:pentapeptide repeat-containing protein [Thalassovita taeanensis]|uniref:Pentapeptide repeat-containing protein n=1 Tax=Thalassovita taeanensis TaxID=657014 RepID=A0A1H9CKJ3_9RHOB|nr:pentapeptide repeat-containing protein [Thalassovita taeanensis]SEQ01736.1 Pentapeptide repeat-containing protein [Thalassovita taeanensis]